MRRKMLVTHKLSISAAASLLVWGWVASAQAQAPQEQRPNILIIWGDDIGQFNISAYNNGMIGYRTPNIDRIGKRRKCTRFPVKSRR